MPRYLIEVPQESDEAAYKRIARSVSALGSHFATRADWSRKDGVCTGSMIVEANDRWGALAIVPPIMRPQAQLFQIEPAAA